MNTNQKTADQGKDQDPRNQGYRAKLAGQRREDNPHPQGTAEHQTWDEGFTNGAQGDDEGSSRD